ncbi:uncharacterized protein LOC105749606 [Sarcophilus harrisii]|uniref:Myb/SANT-like DNA-binding domain-containing protein n=1 Tax=Sarcophilus harrisii TaxID=9305 RepID=G3VS22_SARHA|nr:uncharacterized protein LOC105749606 [Sarcophilus harrisii]
MATPGRKRKANFSNDETETLVWNVVRHFGALYGAEALRTHSAHRNQLWGQIQSRVNFLGYTERSVEDLKHKWRDLRLDVKRKLTSKKGPPSSCGPQKARLTPLEKMVASTFTQASPEAEPEAFFDPEPGLESPMSPALQNGMMVSYDEEDEDTQAAPDHIKEGEEEEEERHGMWLLRHCSSRASLSSLPEELGEGPPGWAAPAVVSDLSQVLSPSQLPPPSLEDEDRGDGSGRGRPRRLNWEKLEDTAPRSPLFREDSLPSSASPSGEPLRGGVSCSRSAREAWRTNLHRLLDLEEQWDQLYHQELGVWQEERAQQREERARDRELQSRLLSVLTDIRDELRYLRQERAFARRSQAMAASATANVTQSLSPPLACPTPLSGTSPHSGASFLGTGFSGPPLAGTGRGESGVLGHGGRPPRRGRGRPRGSTSKHKRL